MTGLGNNSGRLSVHTAPLVTLAATCVGRWTWARFGAELTALAASQPLPSGSNGVLVVDVRGARFAAQGFISAMHILQETLAARRYHLVLIKADWLVRGLYDAYLDAFPEQDAAPPVTFLDEPPPSAAVYHTHHAAPMRVL